MLKVAADTAADLGQFMDTTYIFFNDLTWCILVSLNNPGKVIVLVVLNGIQLALQVGT